MLKHINKYNIKDTDGYVSLVEVNGWTISTTESPLAIVHVKTGDTSRVTMWCVQTKRYRYIDVSDSGVSIIWPHKDEDHDSNHYCSFYMRARKEGNKTKIVYSMNDDVSSVCNHEEEHDVQFDGVRVDINIDDKHIEVWEYEEDDE